MALKKKNQLVGVDIGSHSIKVVEIDHNKRGRFLKNFGAIGLARNAIREGDIVEMEIVAEALQQGMIPLRQNAMRAMLKGTTTYQEVLRITWEQK